MTHPRIDLRHADCLELLATLPDDSIDLIATDPPYYRVKDEDWDRQWKTQEEFFVWLSLVLAEYRRVLKPTGSLYLFAGPHLATRVELAVSEHFKLLNHILWCKPSGRHLGCRKEDLRKYFPQTEHIMFAESRKHLPKDSKSKRYFAVTKHVPYTNVWTFKPVPWYRGKHPCEKPIEMMQHIISASSRPGDTVLDTFVGSGSTAIACRRLSRHFIGCEKGSAEFAAARARLRQS